MPRKSRSSTTDVGVADRRKAWGVALLAHAILFGAATSVFADIQAGGTYPEYPPLIKPDPWGVGTLYIGWSEETGYAAGGSVDIKDGSKVTAPTAYLAYGPLGSGNVSVRGVNPISGAPSEFQAANLAIGWSGEGGISLFDQGILRSQSAVVGNDGFYSESGFPSRGTVNVNGAGCLWDAGTVYVAAAGEGTVDVVGGGRVLSDDAFLGYLHPAAAASGVGTVLVRTGGLWSSSGLFSVGYQGVGNLIVQGRGTVESRTGQVTQDFTQTQPSHATVEDPGSIWRITETLLIGGELAVRAGGRVTNGGDAMVSWPGVRPRVVVQDAGSVWENTASLRVGAADAAGAPGDVQVKSGGAVTCATGHVQDGTVHVMGNNSRWSVGGTLNVGQHGGSARVEIFDSGLVEADDCFIGTARGNGTVRVADAGSRLRVAHDLQIGGDDPGATNVLEVFPGGLVEAGNELVIARLGQLRVQPGGTVATERLNILTSTSGDGGTADLNGAGGIIRVGTLLHAKKREKITFGGGAIDLTDGAAIFEYASPGESPLAYLRDRLIGGRNGGTWNGPGIHSTTAAALVNTSLGIAEASALGVTSFAGLPVDDTTVLIKLTLLGDANLDGTVNITDLGALAGHWQGPGGWSDGDFNYDGVVSIADLGPLATNWQATLRPALRPGLADSLMSLGLPTTSVPEPAYGLLMVVGAVVALRRRWRNCY
jgi:T5SS/PEP-CTERM-associated repeat protein